jgi:hypothetical protein
MDGTTGKPASTLWAISGAAKRGKRATWKHATSIILIESYISNTGEPERDEKEDGK